MTPEEQIAALQAKIEQYEQDMEQVDSDGDPTLAAIQAQKQLPALYKQLLDWTKVAQTRPPSPVMREGPDNNLYQYDSSSGQWTRAPGIPDYVKQPSQRAARFPEELEYDQLRNQKMRMELSGELNPWEQVQWDYKKGQDELQQKQRQEEMQFSKQRAAWSEASDRINTMRQAAPMALIPGQTHFLGYEPGGAWQTVAGKLGLPFDPERFKVPVVNIDPDDAWQKAMAKYGGR